MGMDPRFGITPEDLYNLQMEVKQVQYTQSSHAERLTRLEKRQADDAALKSVWNSPFPGVLSGTPQHGMSNQPPLTALVPSLTLIQVLSPKMTCSTTIWTSRVTSSLARYSWGRQKKSQLDVALPPEPTASASTRVHCMDPAGVATTAAILGTLGPHGPAVVS